MDKRWIKCISDRAITVVINQQSTLPLKDKTQRYFVLTLWAEQAQGIATVMAQEEYLIGGGGDQNAHRALRRFYARYALYHLFAGGEYGVAV